MIVDTQIVEYINALNNESPEGVKMLEQEAHEFHVPIVREETRELLKTLVTMVKPLRILEIGTAIGYSSIIMHQCQPEGGVITTIERNDNRFERAMANIKKPGYEDAITVIKGDALEKLQDLTKEPAYDFIFMDAAKGQYQAFFDLAKEVLKPGGLIVCDNVLQDGDVSKSRFGVERRNRTIHGRMRDFLFWLKRNEEYQTVILPIGDGVAISQHLIQKEA